MSSKLISDQNPERNFFGGIKRTLILQCFQHICINLLVGLVRLSKSILNFMEITFFVCHDFLKNS
jgi:hypothetical protein